MASLPNPKRVTYEEWLQMPVVDDAIEEVVDGEIVIMRPNKWNHALIVENLRDALLAQVDKREFRVVTENFGLIIRKAPLTCRVPDLAVFPKSTIIEKDEYIHSAPQLLLEVVSPSNRPHDIEEKRAEYESIAAPEMWIAHPGRRTVEVLCLEGGRLRTTATLKEGLLKPIAFPHVQVDIAQIWPD